MSPSGVAFLFVGLLTISWPNSAAACRCAAPLSARAELSQSDAVFEGRVISVEKKADTRHVRVAVLRRWRGATTPEEIIDSDDPAMCGVDFKVGERYLIYAFAVSDRLITTNCTSTQLISAAEATLRELGPPLAKVVSARTRGGCGSCRLGPFPSGPSALLLLLLLLLPWIFRRASRRRS